MRGQLLAFTAEGFQDNEGALLYLDDVYLGSFATPDGVIGADGPVTITVPADLPVGAHTLRAHGHNSALGAAHAVMVLPDSTVDLYTYNPEDASTWHLFRGGNPTWNSPTISLLDDNGHPIASNNLVAGSIYTVRLRVFNDSDVVAQGVTAALSWADFGIGQPDKVWLDAGVGDGVDIPARGDALLEVRWTPIKTGHLCLQAEALFAGDANLANNRSQENCTVAPTASPAQTEVLVWNPTDRAAMVHLELRQLAPPGFPEGPLWGASIVQPDPQLIPPGASRTARVVIDPDLANTPVPAGTQVEFALTGFIDGRIIGGANFAITKKPCPVGGCVAGCVPWCEDRECGWDGCEGYCGTCGTNQFCQDGQCLPLPVETCGNGHCGGSEDCDGCPTDCGKCLCLAGQHDNGLGECGTLFTCALGFKVDVNGDCKPEPPSLPFVGLVANGEGLAGWQADGSGPEAQGDGHPIPHPYDTCQQEFQSVVLPRASHYLASPDYPAAAPIAKDSPGAASGVGGVKGFHYLRTAMAGNLVQPGDLNLSFGPLTLGADVQGKDWTFAFGKETLRYTGGDFLLTVQGKPAVACALSPLTMVINYGSQTDCDDDVTSAQTAKALVGDCKDVSAGGPAEAQAVAQGFLQDLELVGSLRLTMTGVKAVASSPFAVNGRKVTLFDLGEVVLK
jgi:hypothetical protein